MITFKEFLSENSLVEVQVKLGLRNLFSKFQKIALDEITEWYIGVLKGTRSTSDSLDYSWEVLEHHYKKHLKGAGVMEYNPLFFKLITDDLKKKYKVNPIEMAVDPDDYV